MTMIFVRAATRRRVHTTPWWTTRRSYMDVHQRPSHSRMFVKDKRPSPPEHPPAQHSDARLYATLLGRAAMAAGIVYVITEYVADITLCEGPSMSPTIKSSGEIVLIDKWSIRRYGIKDGCKGEERTKAAQERQQEYEKTHPDEWHEPQISVTDLDRPSWRRVWQQITTPLSVGDVVVVQHPSRKGTVCKRVLGLPGDQVLDRRLSIVPDGHLWLEGDNPNNSSDSRHYGPLPAALLVGRVWFRIWPLRGHALMERGARPRPTSDRPFTGSTVLPASYEGQEIVKEQKETSR